MFQRQNNYAHTRPHTPHTLCIYLEDGCRVVVDLASALAEHVYNQCRATWMWEAVLLLCCCCSAAVVGHKGCRLSTSRTIMTNQRTAGLRIVDQSKSNIKKTNLNHPQNKSTSFVPSHSHQAESLGSKVGAGSTCQLSSVPVHHLLHSLSPRPLERLVASDTA